MNRTHDTNPIVGAVARRKVRVGRRAAALRGITPPAPQGTVDIPMVEWGSLALRGGRIVPFLPHMSWMVRFPETIDRSVIDAENMRIASTPYGVGRRVMHQRVPGGRPRWRASSDAPPVIYRDEPVKDGKELMDWLGSQMSLRLDPEFGAGWQLASTYVEGGDTVVFVLVHHLFGMGPGLMNTMYEGSPDPTEGTTGLRFDEAGNDYTLKAELGDLGQRLTLGLRGLASVPPAIAGAVKASRNKAPAPADAPPPLKKPRGLDRSRKMLSNDRVVAVAYMPGELWDQTAAKWGGTGSTLTVAVAANLLRRARQARGGPSTRPLQILMPLDLSAREDVDRSDRLAVGPSAEIDMTTANVVLPGGAPVHGDLTELRARMKGAFKTDATEGDWFRGVGDVARLMPEWLTMAAAGWAAIQFDGCVSIHGPLPPGMLEMGGYHASHASGIGFPIGNENITDLFRFHDQVAISSVTDPRRMGPNANLREWLTEEMAAWGLYDVVM